MARPVYVGGATATKAGSTSGTSTISLTALTGGISNSAAAGDLVIAVFASGSTANRTLSITDGATAYTEVTPELYANGSTYDTNLRVAFKLLTAADASVTFGATGSNSDAGAMAVHVWRGVAPTIFDAIPTTATGTGTGRPNPPAILPDGPDAVVVMVGAATASAGAVFTASELSNFRTATSADSNDAMVGIGSYAWSSGSYDPTAWMGGSNLSVDSWAAVTIALKSLDQTLTATRFDNTHEFLGSTVSLSLAPARFDNTNVFFGAAARNTDQYLHAGTLVNTGDFLSHGIERDGDLVFVGGATATKEGSTSGTSTISLTALTGGASSAAAAGDLVIAVFGTGATSNTLLSITDGTTAYTEVTPELYVAGTAYDTNLRVVYKLLTAADASVTFGATGVSSSAGAMAVQVWRNVAPAIFDVTPTTATGTGTGRPNPPAILPTSTDAIVVVVGAAASAAGAVFTNSELSNFRTATSLYIVDAMVGIGSYAWTSGSYDPATWTGGTTDAVDSWAAVTIALKPLGVSGALAVARYDNAQAFYTPTITPGAVMLSASLHTNAGVIYGPTVSSLGAEQDLTASLYTNDSTVFAPTVSPGTATLSPIRHDNTNVHYEPTFTLGAVTLTPARHDNAQAHYGPTVTTGAVTLAATRHDNTSSVVAPTVTRGTVTLLPSLHGNSQSFYGVTLTSGAVTLLPGRLDSAQAFYGPVIATDAVTLLPARLDNAPAFFVPTVISGPVTLSPSLYLHASTFFVPTVTTGVATLSPIRYDNSSVHYGPTLTTDAVTLLPTLVTNSSTFFVATLSQQSPAQDIGAGLTSNVAQFFTATVTCGAVTLAPVRWDNTSALYAPTVQPPTATLVPGLVDNASAFFAHALEAEQTYLVTHAQARALYQMYLLHGLKLGAPLTVSQTQRVAGGLDQAIAEAGGVVTISTLAAPFGVGEDVGTMIEDLAALHGLSVPLEVSGTERRAGAIVQAMSDAGGVTTVTRLP